MSFNQCERSASTSATKCLNQRVRIAKMRLHRKGVLQPAQVSQQVLAHPKVKSTAHPESANASASQSAFNKCKSGHEVPHGYKVLNERVRIASTSASASASTSVESPASQSASTSASESARVQVHHKVPQRSCTKCV